MPEVTITWTKSPSEDVTTYEIGWGVNGQLVNVEFMARNFPMDQNGYTVHYSTIPKPALQAGDVVSACIKAVGPGGSSAHACTPDVTIGPPAPQPPTNPGISTSSSSMAFRPALMPAGGLKR